MSFASSTRIVPRLLSVLALVFALFAPAVVALPANAASGASVSVSQTEINGDDEVVVTIDGTGFDPSLGNGTRPPLAGKPAGAYVVFGAFEDTWQPSAGAGSNTRPVNAGQKWAVLAEDMATIGGANAGAIELSEDGSFTAELTVSKAKLEEKLNGKALEDLNPGIYTYAGSGASIAEYETFTAITFTANSDGDGDGDGDQGGNEGGDDTPPTSDPAVTVSKTEFVGDEEVVVTIDGTGFDPSLGNGTRPPLAGKPAGAYVVFGAFEDTWQPSAGAGSNTRPVNAGQKWAVLAEDMATIGGANAGAIELSEDGSFTAELTVSKAKLEEKLNGKALEDLNPGIYTYGGSGANVAKYETFTPITFAKPDPSVTVSKTEIVGSEVATVTVEGRNFLPSLGTGTRPPLAGKPAGAYVVFGAFEDNWQPSAGAGSGTRPVNAGQKWAVLAEDMATIGGANAGAIELSADGSFTAELTVSKAALEAKLGSISIDDVNPGIYTYGGSGANVAKYETFTPITFVDPSVTVSQTEFIDGDEAVVRVEGKNFLPSLGTGTRPPLAGKPAGAYVVFGAFEDNWRPSAGAGSGTRPVNAGQKWAVLAEDMATIGGANAGAIELSADGSFTADLAVSRALIEAKLNGKSLDDLNIGIYTYGGSGANVADYETFTPITFSNPTPTVTVSQTEFVGAEEAVVRIDGKHFDPSLATGVRPPLAGKPAGAYVVFGAFEDNWRPSAGAGSGTRPVNAGQKWAVLAEDMATIGGANAGAIELSEDGSFTAELTVSKAKLDEKLNGKSLEDLNPGIYTYAGSGANVADYETFTPITFSNPTPTVTVSQTEFVGAEEAVVRIDGKHFDPSLATGVRPPLAGKAAGAYVVFGAFEDTWQPSAGAGSGTRPVNAGQKWAVLAEDMATIGGANAGAIELSADGSFTADLAVSRALIEAKLNGKSLDDLNIGIYTYAGSGANVAAYETFTPITFTEEVGKAKVTVSKSDFDGDKEYQITVKGSGFDPELATGTRPPLSGKAAGSYVVFGAFPAVWQPTKGVDSNVRAVNAGQKWAVLAEDMATIGGASAGAIELTPDGTFSTTFTVSKAKIQEHDAFNSNAGLKVGIYTYAGSGANVEAYETFTPLNFDGDYSNPTKPTTPKPEKPKAGAGSLSWAISSSWISYVNNSVSDGKVSTSGGVKRSGSDFIFGQKSTTAKPPSAVGTTTYRGSVNVYGHSGVMNVTINEPAIRVINDSRAELTASVAGKGRIHIANLNLAAATKSANTGTVKYTGVPVTLTARGASDVFEDFYPAGKSLDRLSFTIGANAKASNASSSSISAAAAKDWTPPADPPATEGLDVSEDEVKVGQTITATARGFVPGEKNIKVVVYSEPIILSQDVQADANGRARWTGQIPGLEPGEHTLTFQGSTNVGTVITVVGDEIVGKCEVTDATLKWGFKEQFRSYVSGMIARGDWEAYDGAQYETPEFIWPSGDGSVDTKQGQINFNGSVDFNGHSGALDMTIDDPKIIFEGSDNATLVLDYAASDISDAIAGKGVKTASPQTPFVSMELSAAKRTVDGNTVTLANIPTRLLGPGAALLTQYGEGERFDDATLVYTLAEGCDPEAAVSEKATTSISKKVLPAQGGVPVFWIAGGTIAALLALIAGIVWAIRRRMVRA